MITHSQYLYAYQKDTSTITPPPRMGKDSSHHTQSLGNNRLTGEGDNLYMNGRAGRWRGHKTGSRGPQTGKLLTEIGLVHLMIGPFVKSRILRIILTPYVSMA